MCNIKDNKPAFPRVQLIDDRVVIVVSRDRVAEPHYCLDMTKEFALYFSKRIRQLAEIIEEPSR